MRNVNIDPFFRTSVGFDRLFDLMDGSRQFEGDTYPPYNISRTGEENYRITLAVAGFKPENIEITAHGDTLLVAAKPEQQQEASEMLYRGIASRAFERRFSLAEHVQVTGAAFENGLLQIDLERRIPEAMKPRRIELKTPASASGNDNVTQLDQAKVA